MAFLTPGFLGAAETSILPEALRTIAKERGCSEVSDFFQRPGLVDPPYVLGYLGGDRESSAAFWCTRLNAAEKYLLVVVGKNNKCPSEISWQNYPGGLTVLRGKKVGLSDFFERRNVTRRGPPGRYTAGPIIHSEYDGVGVEFYCNEGVWLVRQFH
jgi:hypothetical protein